MNIFSRVFSFFNREDSSHFSESDTSDLGNDDFYHRASFREEDQKLRSNKQLNGLNNIAKFGESLVLTFGQIFKQDLWLFFIPFAILFEILRVFYSFRETWITKNKQVSQQTKIIFNIVFGLLFISTTVAAVFSAFAYSMVLPYVACAIFVGRFFWNAGLTLGYIIRLCDPTANLDSEYKAHCRRQRDKYAINTFCNLFCATSSIVVLGLGLASGGIAQMAIMGAAGIVASINAFYLGGREFRVRPENRPKATVSDRVIIERMAKYHTPDTPSFFHRDIIQDLQKIEGDSGERFFLETLIHQKTSALKAKLALGNMPADSQKKIEHKLYFLEWLKTWLENSDHPLEIPGTNHPEKIADIPFLMNFLDGYPEFKDNIFSSPLNGTGETEGLLRAVAEYFDIQKQNANNSPTPDNSKVNVSSPPPEPVKMANTHKPGTASFFYRNIINDLWKIHGTSKEPVFLATIIEQKINDLNREQKQAFIKQKNKHESKAHFLEWLKEWVTNPDTPLVLPTANAKNSVGKKIQNIDELNKFLDENIRYKEHVFASSKNAIGGTGETAGLLKVVEEYMEIKAADERQPLNIHQPRS